MKPNPTRVAPARPKRPAALAHGGLSAVALALKPGDQLGLILFSRHPQFNTLPLDFADGMTFTGAVSLPAAHAALIEFADPSVVPDQAVVGSQ